MEGASVAVAAMGAYGAVDRWISDGVAWCFRDWLGMELKSSPATSGLPTVDSPTIVILAAALYLLSVGVGLFWIRSSGLKPRVREPWPLQALVLLHNALCLSLSLYMCVGIAYEAYTLRYSLWGNAYDPNQKEMARFIYIFYMSKYLEFMDTIIMLLKRKVQQVSVLHVYHHFSIALIWWVTAHQAPGGEAYFSATLNSGVHVFMYLYYMLSAILRDDATLRNKYLFWGKYLTQLQMLQFAMNMAQAYYDLKVGVPYPPVLTKILYYYMISLLVLFGNFYVRKYLSFEKSKGHKAE